MSYFSCLSVFLSCGVSGIISITTGVESCMSWLSDISKKRAEWCELRAVGGDAVV